MSKNQVNTVHRIYQKLKPRWAMVRDAVEGEWAVKDAGQVYLPKLTGQEESEYKAYIARALFFEATRRTLNGLNGMVFRKEPTIEAKETTKELYLPRVTKDGESFQSFAQVVLREVLMLNKYGIMADLPEQITSESEPWLVGYTAESIINWRFGTDPTTGRKILTRVVLEEAYERPDPEDQFKVLNSPQWRVLELLPREVAEADQMGVANAAIIPKQPQGSRDIYRVQVWRKKKDSPDKAIATSATEEEFIIEEETFPSFQNTGMAVIPFIIVTAEDEDKEDQKPPLEGLASVNMSHYRSSADLEHGRHFTALPTPYVIGLAEQQDLTIGSSKAWMIVGANKNEVEIGMLEFEGKGLEALENALEEKQKQMAILGARLLEEAKKAVEAFETHQLRSAGEQSILAAVATGVSEGINESMEFMTLWDPSLGEITIQLNTDFIMIGMEPTMLTALIGGMQAGKMSFKTFFYNMQLRGMYPDGFTEEEELGQIESDTPEAAIADDLDDEGPNKKGEEEEEEEE